mgnify:FL=1
MRNLSRIIFINSANIPYSDDIYLDGNVHFIGTQGVGKSTILRAILFFYNADTQRLGISVEKQNYTDYYFPYSNSYIVYEVATENDAFCILSFKSMNRVCYRFIHSPYRKEFFIDENRMAYSESDRVRAVLDQHGIEYSRIIYTYDEYRNILYGNSTSPEFSRYSLMESKQYQNIPRTIQNVLLNSKLDAEFIKKTIISSLNEDETAIDLNSYKEHLKNFETRLKDIEEFQKRETRKQAREITLLSQQTSQLQGGLVQNCRELVTAFRKAESILPQWKEKQDRADAGKGKLIRRKQELQDESRKRSDKLQEALAVLNNELQKALGKEKDYQKKNIEEIIERSSKKEEWKNRQVGLLEEQRILTSQYMEISTKYKSLIQTLDEQWNKIHEAKIKQLDTLNNTYNERLEEARKEYQRFTDSLYQEFETLSQQLHPLKAEKLSELNAMDYQIKLCRKEIFFEEEQQELKARIQNYANFHTERKNRIAQAQLTIKELTMTWEEEQQKLLKEKDLTFQKLQQEMLQLRPRIDELQAFLDNSKDTLQGWLKENKKGWEENIGKLCDESILWQRGLFPQSTIEGGNSFYGISINLDSIHRPIKSIDDYIAEKENGEKRLEEITAAMQRLQTEKEEVQEQLKRKYQPQIKEQKNLISQIEYELEQLERQYQQDMLDLEEWKKKANEERNTKINQLENEKRKRAAELEGINNKLKNLNKEKTEKLDNLKQAWNQQQTLATEKKTQAEIIGKEEKEEQRRISSIKAEYEADMQKELHSQGADTERLQDIANQLAQLDKELSFIKENATLVIEYQKDKRDLIDRIPGWQREHDEQKRLLQQERETLRAETSSLQEKIDLLNKELEEAEENVRELQKNLEAYSKISAYDWYKPHQDIFHSETAQTIQTTKTCMELIDELTRQANQFTQVQSKLRKEVNLFTGHFDEDNTFKFRVKFNEDWEYVRFADELHDFVEENRIDEYIRRINNEHWDTFKRISMDTSMLTSSEDDIQDVIREINKGFATCNFVGVIQRIEMKVEESSNRVVNILREIQKYYHDYGYDLSPETNLFSSAKEQLVKEEAITLLRTFIKEIHAYRYDSIRLYDSFELRFRIVENGNDTGFIEKIANVGSEGTDILVKAMINIMLLNVFKEGASRKFKDFKLHCMMDEIGKLHPNNISGILKFANDRNIILINGSPTELNRDAYKHVYLLTKGTQNKTRIARLISDKQL